MYSGGDAAPVADDTMMGCTMRGQQLPTTFDAYSLGLEDTPDDDFDFLGPLEGTPSPFSVGQAVTVLSDVAKVRELTALDIRCRVASSGCARTHRL